MIMKNILAGVLLFITVACAEVSSSKSTPFDELLNDHWENVLAEQVFFRRDPDVFRMNGHLPDFSKPARDRRQAFNETVLTRLAAIDEASLSQADQVNYKLFKYEREAERESYRQSDYLFPMNFYAGFHTYFAEAPAKMSFLSEEDYDQYLVSLADYPRYSNDFITTLEEAITDRKSVV